MSSLVISGDVSGTVTLQAPSAAGTTVLTLPATSGTVLTTASGNAVSATTATTATTATNLANGGAGTIPYQSASGTTAMLAIGTSGQVLQTNGAAAPTWVTPSGGGTVYISTITATAASTVSFTSVINSTYDDYIVEVSNLAISAGSRLCFLISEDNGANYLGGSYFSNEIYLFSGTLGGGQRNTTIGSVTNDTYYMTTAQASFISFRLCNLNAVSTRKQFSTIASLSSGGGAVRDITDCSYNTSSNTINAVQFSTASGATITGTFRLYGVKKS